MTCREFIEFLNDYLAGELQAGERTEFERHLGLCVACRNYLQTYEATIRLGQAACSGPEPPPMPEDLVAAILAARARRG